MIEAIREIGEYSLKTKGKRIDNPINIIVEDPGKQREL